MLTALSTTWLPGEESSMSVMRCLYSVNDKAFESIKVNWTLEFSTPSQEGFISPTFVAYTIPTSSHDNLPNVPHRVSWMLLLYIYSAFVKYDMSWHSMPTYPSLIPALSSTAPSYQVQENTLKLKHNSLLHYRPLYKMTLCLIVIATVGLTDSLQQQASESHRWSFNINWRSRRKHRHHTVSVVADM